MERELFDLLSGYSGEVMFEAAYRTFLVEREDGEERVLKLFGEV